MNKFKFKVIGRLSIIIIAIVVLLTTMSYHAFRDNSNSLNKRLLKQRSALIKAQLSEKFNAYKKELSSINASLYDIIGGKLSDRIIAQLNVYYRANKEISDTVAIFTKNGDMYGWQGNKLNFNIKTLNRSYYNALFRDNRQFFVSLPFKSALTGKEVIAMAYKIDHNVAVMSAVYLNSILNPSATRKKEFIYAPDGTILSSPDPELNNKNIYNIYPKYKSFSPQHPELTYSMSIDGQPVHFTAFWAKLDTVNWNFVTFIRDETIEKDANKQLWSSLEVGFVALILAIIVLLYMIQKLVIRPVGGPPEDIAAFIEQMAAGDFSHEFDENESRFGIYHSAAYLSHHIKGLIQSSHHISDQVFSAAKSLNAVMQNTQSNAQHQLSKVEQISAAISELSSTSQEVSQQAATAEDSAKKAQNYVGEGQHTLDVNIEMAHQINESAAETAAIVEELRSFTLEISSVIQVINDVSEQTNLLALNAAIEAARAGTYGRGFAVVAEEVRNLAQKTQQSTVSIQHTIEKLQSHAEKVNLNMNDNLGLIQQSVDLIDKVKVSFEQISDAVHHISDVNTMVASAAQEQSTVTEDISHITEDTLHSVNDNVSAVRETLAAATNLSQLAESQQKELSVFKL
jgi:methyl-accepting chemotaxis protein